MKPSPRNRFLPLAPCLLALAGCHADAPQALGTLEYDRVALPAPVAERIVSIDVREGQRVEAGAKLLTLERTRNEAQAQAARAQAQRHREALADARQRLGALEYDRVAPPAPVAERIVSIAVREGQRVEAGAKLLTLERTRNEAQAQAARAQAQRQREALAELQAGPRSEDIA